MMVKTRNGGLTYGRPSRPRVHVPRKMPKHRGTSSFLSFSHTLALKRKAVAAKLAAQGGMEVDEVKAKPSNEGWNVNNNT